MSTWHEIKKNDISIENGSLHAFLFSDDMGAVYCSIDLNDLFRALEKYADRLENGLKNK